MFSEGRTIKTTTKIDLAFLVAVKKTSIRVPNKNTRDFGNSSLLKIKIRQLQRICEDQELNSMYNLKIYCLIDDKEIEEHLKAYTGITSILRDTKYSQNDIPMSDVFRYFTTLVQEEHIGYVNCTNPLLKDHTLKNMLIGYYLQKSICKKFRPMTTVTVLKEFVWSLTSKKPINYSIANQERSQDLNDLVFLNFAVSLLPRKTMFENKNIVCPDSDLYCIDEKSGFDIDTMLDFEFAEMLYKKENNL